MAHNRGRLVGASTAVAANVPEIGGRHFWVLRTRLADSFAPQAPALLAATYRALEAAPTAPGMLRPVGVCAVLGPTELAHHSPAAEWPVDGGTRTRFLYAGYREDGNQLRIAYFPGALIGPGSSLGDRDWSVRGVYEIVPFDAQDTVRAADVSALWVREGALSATEAERRVSQLLLVAIDDGGRPVGVCTAYLSHHPRLGATLWHYRTFVAAAHRKSHLGVQLALGGRQHLVARHSAGEDDGAIGVAMEIENPMLRRLFPEARWWPTDFTFLGETSSGAHLRVHYFPGSPAPRPAQGST